MTIAESHGDSYPLPSNHSFSTSTFSLGTWLLSWGASFPASIEASVAAWLRFGQLDVSRSNTRRHWTSFPLLGLGVSDKDRAKWPVWALDNLVGLLTYLWTAEFDNNKLLSCSSHRVLDLLVTAASPGTASGVLFLFLISPIKNLLPTTWLRFIKTTKKPNLCNSVTFILHKTIFKEYI